MFIALFCAEISPSTVLVPTLRAPVVARISWLPVPVKSSPALFPMIPKVLDVAFVVVEFTAVKFCSVVDPVRRRLEKVPKPSVREPIFAEVENRFVEEAVVEKKLVVVAADPVAFTKVKFWRVEEPVRRRFEKSPKRDVMLLSIAVLARISVVDARPET